MMLPGVKKWKREFDRAPDEQLDRLLRGLVPLGSAGMVSLAEILWEAFRPSDERLDETIAKWLPCHILQPLPPGMTPGRWATALMDIFRAITRLRLAQTGALLRQEHERLRIWLEPMYDGPSCDPEMAYLQALAFYQENQSLSPLWRRLALGEEMADSKDDRGARDTGLLGLSKLPAADGKPQSGVPDALLQVLVLLAGRAGMSHDEWDMRVRATFAAYPLRSQAFWSEKFYSVLNAVSADTSQAERWLGQLLPKWGQVAPNHERQGGAAEPPPWQELDAQLSSIKRDPSHAQSAAFSALLERYRNYTRTTGHTEYLVKTFCNVASTVGIQGSQYASWAADLVREAIYWEPNNPKARVVYAQTLWRAEQHREAIDQLWEARQHLAWNPFIQSELGHHLAMAGDLQTAYEVYAEAATDFPNDVVCRTALGYLLLELGEVDEAGGQFAEARQLNRNDTYVQAGLAEVWFIQSARNNDTELRERARELLRRVGDDDARERLSSFDRRWQQALERGGERFVPDLWFGHSETANACEPLPQLEIEEMAQAERLGRAMIALRQTEQAEPGLNEQDTQAEHAFRLLDIAETEIEASLLRGFVITSGLVFLARGEWTQAINYFKEQIERYGRGSWIGVRLGYERARAMVDATAEIDEAAAAFDTSSGQFAFHVVTAMRSLANADRKDALIDALHELFPIAKRLAREWRLATGTCPSEDGRRHPDPNDQRELVGGMVANFVEEAWLKPAGISEQDDIDDPDKLRDAITYIQKTEGKTVRLLDNMLAA